MKGVKGKGRAWNDRGIRTSREKKKASEATGELYYNGVGGGCKAV